MSQEITATLTFSSYDTAKAFGTRWACYSLRGYALGAKQADGSATLTLYRVTETDKQWIDAQVQSLSK